VELQRFRAKYLMVAVESVHRPDDEKPNQVELPPDVFLGRQPILDAKEQLWGYELLYREHEDAEAEASAASMSSTSAVVINTLAELGIEQVVGAKRMLIGCPAEALNLSTVAMLPQGQVMLEVLSDVERSAENLERLAMLTQAGFEVALDDYRGENEMFLDAASLLKIDLQKVELSELSGLVAGVAKQKLHLLVTNVDTREQFTACKELGFHFFQGYYFCQPEIVRGKRPPANQMALMKLLSKVNDPETKREELAALISSDVSLSFRLLRCLNSAAFSFAREVETVEHALMLLGESRLREWVGMLAISKIPNKPSELSRVALLRAHMCEGLAKKTGAVDPKAMFTVGLFSVLDTMMDYPMKKIVRELPLADDIEQALLGKPGALAGLLAMVVSYEKTSWENLSSLGMRAEQMSAIWVTATKTMEASFDYLAASPGNDNSK